MDMKRFFSAAVVLLLLVYIGYQVSQNLTEQIETIDALIVEAVDKTTCEGIFVRNVQPVYGDGDKTYEFLAENGEKVARGSQVAVFFDDPAAAEAFRQARALEADIASARAACSTIQSDEGGLTLDADIFSDMETLSGLLTQGKAWQTDAVYSSMSQAIVARDYPREDVGTLETAIAAMESQRKSLDAAAAGGRAVTAQQSGYFIKATESGAVLCSVEEMYALTPDSLAACVQRAQTASPEEGVIGYIMESFEWCFVCTMPAEDAAAIEKRSSVELSFPYISTERIPAKIDRISYYTAQAVVIFRCGFIDEEFLRCTAETCDVVKQTYTGIRVPKEALHLNDGQWGVYCLSGAMIKFKPVEWLYQGDSYYIARPAESAAKGLYLYDKIVVSGKDLEVNKVIK